MDNVIQSKSNEIWKVRRNLTKKNDPKMSILGKEGNLITSNNQIKDRYAEYYQELLCPRQPEKEAVETIEQAYRELNRMIKIFDSDETNLPFTEKELDTAVKRLKDKKCPGHDGITNELIKASGEQLKKSILSMINWMWLHENIPTPLHSYSLI